MLARESDLLYWLLAGGILFYALRRASLPGSLSIPAWTLSPASTARDVDEGGPGDSEGVFVDMPKTNSKQIAQSTIDLVKRMEGLRLNPYPDAGGYSVGYGHYLGASRGQPITQEQANLWLAQDLQKAAGAVRGAVTVPLSQNQFDALVSFTYNLGAGSLKRSSLLRLLNGKDYTGAARQFTRWVYSQGSVSPGLVARRKTERALFEKG